MSTGTDQVYRPLGAYDLLVLRFIATRAAVDYALYGARRQTRSRFTLAAILVLLLTSTIFTISDQIFYLIQLPVAVGTSERNIDADAVLVWRAWCLWPNSRFVRGILSVCLCGTVVGSTAELSWFYWPTVYNPDVTENNGQFLFRWIPLLITNIVATALFGAKVLHYRKEIKGSLGLFTPQRTQAEAVLLLLLESGIVYIVFWVCDYTLATITLSDLIHLVQGIYPTCVLFAAARGTTDSLLSAQVSKAMRFAGSPAAHEGARETNMTVDFHLQDENSVGALNNGPQDSHADNIPGPSGVHGGEYRFSSSEGIVEVERETTAM
ncbi:hypothetical protein K525DRAFT_288316 [Schizophyllum commune Loenen D]|nr:hypothetical protein K525DRAFT_288316 [Schizophyllum commune Loenen D]